MERKRGMVLALLGDTQKGYIFGVWLAYAEQLRRGFMYVLPHINEP